MCWELLLLAYGEIIRLFPLAGEQYLYSSKFGQPLLASSAGVKWHLSKVCLKLSLNFYLDMVRPEVCCV